MAQKCIAKNTLISRNWHEYFGKICFAILNCYTKLIILFTYYQFSILLWKIYSVRPFKIPPNRKRCGQRPKSPLNFETVQIFSGISYWKKGHIQNYHQFYHYYIHFDIKIPVKIWTVSTLSNFRELFGLRPRPFPFGGTLQKNVFIFPLSIIEWWAWLCDNMESYLGNRLGLQSPLILGAGHPKFKNLKYLLCGLLDLSKPFISVISVF